MLDEEEYLRDQPDYEEIKDYLSDDGGDPPQFEIPPFEPNYDNALVIDGIPVVDSEKKSKLMGVLLKMYTQISPDLKEEDIEMPMNPVSNESFGFCYIKFQTKDEANAALTSTQGFKMSKYQFKISHYSDLDKYNAVPEEFVCPEYPPMKKRPDPTSWLADDHCRDQFVVRYDHETEISWANITTGEDPTTVYAGEREKQEGKSWCENQVTWSPQGTYLATFHPQGIKLWGSTGFESQGKMQHNAADMVDFSPCENYMVSYAYHTYDPSSAIIVWNISNDPPTLIRQFALREPLEKNFQAYAEIDEPLSKADKKKVEGTTEKTTKKRIIRGRIKSSSFDGASKQMKYTLVEDDESFPDIPQEKVKPLQEPNRLKWSPDGKYLARLSPDKLEVYELPGMNLLEKKSIAAKDVMDFMWSPRSNMISYWSPAVGNHPALINIISIPDRTNICSRKIVDVKEGRMVWQNDGEYLCVYVVKVTNKKKSTVLMLFRVNESGVPVEQTEISSEHVYQVAWEPSGDRFAVLQGEAKNASCKSIISFFSMSGSAPGAGKGVKARKELVELFKIQGEQCGVNIPQAESNLQPMLWSPAGGVIALAYFASDSVSFQLHDVDSNQCLAKKRHERGNRLYWDPCGRLLASCTITELRNKNAKGNSQDGFNLYSFQGELKVAVKREKLYSFSWRPRPKDLMTPEEKKAVIKNIGKYRKQFESEDNARKIGLNQEKIAERTRVAFDLMSLLSTNKQLNASRKLKRVQLRNGYDSDDDINYDMEEKVIETVVSTKDQVISSNNS